MAIRPADGCCCGCSLAQGVHTLSVYAVCTGFISTIALLLDLMSHNKQDEQSEHMQRIIKASNCMHILGIFFGLRGFIGLYTRNPEALKIFMWYYPYCWVVNTVITVLRQPYICKDVLKPEDIEKDCGTVITTSWIIVGLQFLLYTYFAYIIWSLAHKLVASGATGLLSADNDVGLVPFAADLQPYYPVQNGRPGAGRPPQQMGPMSSNQVAPHQDNFAPFSGHAYKLND